MKTLLATVLSVLLFAATASAQSAAVYPGRYSTSGTAYTSDVIVGPTATIARGGSQGVARIALVGCEWYNGDAAARSLMFFDSATVPADGTPAFKVFIANCPATTHCSWGMNGGPAYPQGGTGVIFQNGLSWANSTTFPSKTLGSADSTLACSYLMLQ